jgi:phosphoribulokinase
MAVVDGDGFHLYHRADFAQVVAAAEEAEHPSHFSPKYNMFDKLDTLLSEYSQTGCGQHRRYLHDDIEAANYHQEPGTFTPWTSVPEDTDVLCYQGLHGCFVDDDYDIAGYMDLKIGVVPVVNLEWIRKIHRDIQMRGYRPDDVTETILRRMPDYLSYIAPQFSRTDINFQRVPMVDTSNPFVALDTPLEKETVVVIRVAQPERLNVDFLYLLNMVPKSFMSRRNSIVVPGDELGYAMELIFAPIMHDLLEKRREAKSGQVA